MNSQSKVLHNLKQLVKDFLRLRQSNFNGDPNDGH